MRRVTYRVGKDVLDLPPQTHVTYRCTISNECRAIYEAIEEDFIAQVEGGTITVANAMVALLRLQQIAGGWLKTDDGQYRRVDWAKQRLLEDTLEDIGPGEPVVVFCRFHGDLDAVHDACKALAYTSLELSGAVTNSPNGNAEKRRSWPYRFERRRGRRSDPGPLLELTTRFHFRWANYDRRFPRVHRPGQTRPVEHIRLVARQTVDERSARA
jgi:SNF2 family DNA or RNA helicase